MSDISTQNCHPQELSNLYCGTMGLEVGHIESEAEQRWLCDKHQEVRQQPLEASVKRDLALEMLKSQTFDNFLATKFQSVKRYGGEGAEAMMGFFTQLFHQAQADNIEDIIIAEVLFASRSIKRIFICLLHYRLTEAA